MIEIADKVRGGRVPNANEDGLETRLFRTMIASVVVAVALAAAFAPWRVMTGLLLGGVLSLISHHWLRSSIAAAFNVEESGNRPRVRIWRYIFRYLLIGVVGFVAFKLQVISLPAMLVGLCSFVPALLAEALRQFYYAIIHREEIS